MFKKDSDLEAFIYTEIGKELESKSFDMPLWIKAQEVAGGNEAKIQSEYIKLRKDKLYKNLINNNKSLESIAPKLFDKKKEIDNNTSGIDALVVILGWIFWSQFLINFEAILPISVRVPGGIFLFVTFLALSKKTLLFISKLFI